MEERPIFVPCVRWVKRGVADPNPTKIKLSKEELGEIISFSKSKFEKKNIKSKERKNKDDEDDTEDKYKFSEYDEEEPGEVNFHDLCTDVNDPYIKEDDGDSSDDETRIYPNDNLVLAAHIDKDSNVLEVYLRNADDDDLYVHHDIILSDYPLCLEWVGVEPMSEGATGNLCAIGSMSPIIEMWDLNIINCLEPACKLGQKPSKKKQTEGIGHTDAVLDISWNSNLPHILGSGSADKTVLLWDLDKGCPATKISTFSEKVQALKWHPFEGFMLLTGSCDNFARVFDCRTDDTFKQWNVDGEVERVCWNHFNPFEFLVSTNTGSVYCVDCRKNDALWTTQAHSSAVTGLTLSANCPGLLTTASMDSDIKVWDIADGNEPVCIAVQKSRVGPVLCLEFCPDSPFEICAGGKKRDGYFSVWNLIKEPKVAERFSSRQLLQTKTVADISDKDRDLNHSVDEKGEEEEELKSKSTDSKEALGDHQLISVEEPPVKRKKKKETKEKCKVVKKSSLGDAMEVGEVITESTDSKEMLECHQLNSVEESPVKRKKDIAKKKKEKPVTNIVSGRSGVKKKKKNTEQNQ